MIDASIYNNVQQPPSTIQTLGAISQLKGQQQQQQMGALELEHKQRQMASETALNNAMSTALDASGNIDESKLAKALAGTPAAAKWPEIQQHLSSLREAKQKMAAAEADHVGALASAADAAGDDPQAKAAVLLTGIASGIRDGSIPKDHGSAILSQFIGADGNPDPAAVTRTIATMKAASQKQTELGSARMTAEARKTTATTGAAKLIMEAPGIQAKTAVEQQIAAGTQGGINPYQQAEIKNQQQQRAISAGQLAVAQQREKREAAKPPAADKLVRVEHKDDVSGRTVIEWLPQSQLAGQKFEKGTNATTENRLASAQAVNQTGQDMIAKLSDPAFANKLGPVMGRANTLRDFIGNPPPEYAELAGEIESYAIATMGVHGMRSTTGAEQIKKLLDSHHTPASLVSTIKGLSAFSNHLMQNEGRGPTGSGAGPAATGRFNPATGKIEPVK